MTKLKLPPEILCIECGNLESKSDNLNMDSDIRCSEFFWRRPTTKCSLFRKLTESERWQKWLTEWMGIDDTCPCGIEAHPLSPYYNPNACHIKGCKYDPKNSNFLQDMLNATIDSAALNISEKEELIKKIQGIQKTIKGES